MNETTALACAWCDNDHAPTTRCPDCGRVKCDMCGRCEPCIDGPAPLAEPFAILAATQIAAGIAVMLADRIPDPDARGEFALAIDPLLAISQAAEPFAAVAAWMSLIQVMTP